MTTKKLQSSVVCLFRPFIQKEIQTYCKLDANKFKHTVCYLILASSSTAILGSSAYASEESPYDSGYDHGCDDARISDPDDRYINQPEKGPSFHTDRFMDGYNDGFGACSGNNIGGNGGVTDVLDAQGCYDTGYEDGLDFPADSGTNDYCRQFTDDQGNPYYTGFIDGCMSVEGNTLDVCESATD
jgi:hypothetical protein